MNRIQSYTWNGAHLHAILISANWENWGEMEVLKNNFQPRLSNLPKWCYPICSQQLSLCACPWNGHSKGIVEEHSPHRKVCRNGGGPKTQRNIGSVSTLANSMMEFFSGFWQTTLSQGSREHTTFITPFWPLNVSSFGIYWSRAPP